jgi:hypothetical protein
LPLLVAAAAAAGAGSQAAGSWFTTGNVNVPTDRPCVKVVSTARRSLLLAGPAYAPVCPVDCSS